MDHNQNLHEILIITNIEFCDWKLYPKSYRNSRSLDHSKSQSQDMWILLIYNFSIRTYMSLHPGTVLSDSPLTDTVSLEEFHNLLLKCMYFWLFHYDVQWYDINDISIANIVLRTIIDVIIFQINNIL